MCVDRYPRSDGVSPTRLESGCPEVNEKIDIERRAIPVLVVSSPIGRLARTQAHALKLYEIALKVLASRPRKVAAELRLHVLR